MTVKLAYLNVTADATTETLCVVPGATLWFVAMETIVGFGTGWTSVTVPCAIPPAGTVFGVTTRPARIPATTFGLMVNIADVKVPE